MKVKGSKDVSICGSPFDLSVIDGNSLSRPLFFFTPLTHYFFLIADNRVEVNLRNYCSMPDWNEEVSQILLKFSLERKIFTYFLSYFCLIYISFFTAKSHRRIFEEIGFDQVVKMGDYTEIPVLQNMANVFNNLIQLDQNKVKMIKEGGTSFISTLVKLVKDKSLGEYPDLENFLSRGLAYLSEQPKTTMSVISSFGAEIFLHLLTR